MKIMQLLKDNAERVSRPVNVIRNGDSARINIYDVIDSFWGFSAQNMLDAVAQAGDAKTLDIYISSPGGDVFESRAIMAQLKRFPGNTVAHIDGLCASAATSIALACNEVEMHDGGFFMIHNASGMAWGDKTEMRSTADLLEKVEGVIIADYMTKTGKPADAISAMMDAETWMTAQEALDNGFIDRIVTSESGATNKANWNLSAYANAPMPIEQPEPDLTEQITAQLQHNRNRMRLMAQHQI